MGTTFSSAKKKDRIFEYEEKIMKLEAFLENKRNGTFSIKRYAVIGALLSSISLIAVKTEAYKEPLFFILAAFIGSLYFLYRWAVSYKIRRAEQKLKILKGSQKKIIDEYKREASYEHAKKLIEKYDNNESRETFFRQIQRKKRDATQKMADYILGNDPTKMNALICKGCGVHNGLVDPHNPDFPYYYCFNCNAKNERIK